MNALVRASTVILNAAYLLNVDCDNYINNSKALHEAMCFMMDPASGKKICYVQFPQRFDGIDHHDRYANRNTVFFDISKPPPTSTISFTHFKNRKTSKKGQSKENKKIKKSREALTEIHALENIEERIEGIKNEKSFLIPQINFEKKFGQSPVFVASTLQEEGGVPPRAISASVLKEALHVISCGYEDKTKWGKEVGWIYGSVIQDALPWLAVRVLQSQKA